MFLHVLQLSSQQFPADTARQRGWWEPHLQRRHLARASHPAHCAPNMLREAGETLFWLGTCHGGCPWARQAEQEAPRCHGFASMPVPAGDRLDLSPRGASASQPAGTRGASKARCSPTPKCQQEASSQRAKAWTPCQLSTGCRRRTPKPAQSPISRKLTCLNKINK